MLCIIKINECTNQENMIKRLKNINKRFEKQTVTQKSSIQLYDKNLINEDYSKNFIEMVTKEVNLKDKIEELKKKIVELETENENLRCVRT